MSRRFFKPAGQAMLVLIVGASWGTTFGASDVVVSNARGITARDFCAESFEGSGLAGAHQFLGLHSPESVARRILQLNGGVGEDGSLPEPLPDGRFLPTEDYSSDVRTELNLSVHHPLFTKMVRELADYVDLMTSHWVNRAELSGRRELRLSLRDFAGALRGLPGMLDQGSGLTYGHMLYIQSRVLAINENGPFYGASFIDRIIHQLTDTGFMNRVSDAATYRSFAESFTPASMAAVPWGRGDRNYQNIGLSMFQLPQLMRGGFILIPTYQRLLPSELLELLANGIAPVVFVTPKTSGAHGARPASTEATLRVSYWVASGASQYGNLSFQRLKELVPTLPADPIERERAIFELLLRAFQLAVPSEPEYHLRSMLYFPTPPRQGLGRLGLSSPRRPPALPSQPPLIEGR